MPPWLVTILRLVLFFVFLSFLILVHEAGHFATAKIFKVYCDDFSIGFGKAFFHKKRKNGETYFSLRVFPFGGYVAMAGDEGELREGLNIPKERTIAGVNKWAAALIMSAGIIVNIIFSILFIYVSNQAFPVENIYYNTGRIKEGSVADNVGLVLREKGGQEGYFLTISPDYRVVSQAPAYYSYDSVAHYEDGTTQNVVAVVNQTEVKYNYYDFDKLIKFYEIDEEFVPSNPLDEHLTDYVVGNFSKQVTAESTNEAKKAITSVDLVLHTYGPHAHAEGEEPHYFCSSCGQDVLASDIENIDGHLFHKNCTHPTASFKDKKGNYTKASMGVVLTNAEAGPTYTLPLPVIANENGSKEFTKPGFELYKESYYKDFSTAWVDTFKEFGNGSVAIFKAIGNLFIGKGWDQTGSIIAIVGQQSQVLDVLGPSYLFRFWGLISVNLAIFNLLPFPGLDGWQLLVIAIEGISRRKLPDKFKTIMSYIGLGLLFTLMAVLVVKDIVMLFI